MTEVRIGWIGSSDYRVSDWLCIRGSDQDSWKTVIGGQMAVELPRAGPSIGLSGVDALSKSHYAQVRSYLEATRLPYALLVNFAQQRAEFPGISQDHRHHLHPLSP